VTAHMMQFILGLVAGYALRGLVDMLFRKNSK